MEERDFALVVEFGEGFRRVIEEDVNAGLMDVEGASDGREDEVDDDGLSDGDDNGGLIDGMIATSGGIESGGLTDGETATVDNENSGLLLGQERRELCFCNECLEVTGLSVLQLESMFAMGGQRQEQVDSSSDHCDPVSGPADHNSQSFDGQSDEEDD